MRITPAKLPDALVPGAYMLRSSDFNDLLNPQLSYTEAVAMAYRGEIEGIATQSGRVKYLRLLDDDERLLYDYISEEGPDVDCEGSTAFARTNLGVFREAIRASVVTESFGHRAAVASGEVTGHVWTHCQCR